MPAPFPPNDSAIVRFRYTKAQPQRDPIAPPPGSPPGTPFIIPPSIGPGHEDTEQFELHPPTGDIAEVERQWKLANPPESEKEWQDAFFPGPEAAPTKPMAPKQIPDVDAQGLRHRAAGETELRGTVTEGVPVPGRGVGFAEEEAQSRADNLDDMTVEELHERATQLEVEGRGSMNKSELKRAIRKAEKK
jgi:hypothetical protein